MLIINIYIEIKSSSHYIFAVAQNCISYGLVWVYLYNPILYKKVLRSRMTSGHNKDQRYLPVFFFWSLSDATKSDALGL